MTDVKVSNEEEPEGLAGFDVRWAVRSRVTYGPMGLEHHSGPGTPA